MWVFPLIFFPKSIGFFFLLIVFSKLDEIFILKNYFLTIYGNSSFLKTNYFHFSKNNSKIWKNFQKQFSWINFFNKSSFFKICMKKMLSFWNFLISQQIIHMFSKTLILMLCPWLNKNLWSMDSINSKIKPTNPSPKI